MIVHDLPPAAPAPQVEAAHHCRQGSRDCFPHELAQPHVAYYRVQVGGYETLYTAEGEPMDEQFVLDGLNVAIPDPGFFGHGIRAALEAAAAAEYPDKDLIDFWPLSAPPASEF